MSRIVHNWKPIKVDEIEVASHRYTSNEVEASSARWFTSHFGIEIVSVTVENTITSSLKQPLAFFFRRCGNASMPAISSVAISVPASRRIWMENDRDD